MVPFGGRGRKVFALRLDSQGAQFEEDDGTKTGQTNTFVRLDQTWLLRHVDGLTPFYAFVDDENNVWDVIAVREIGRRRHVQVDVTRTIPDPREDEG